MQQGAAGKVSRCLQLVGQPRRTCRQQGLLAKRGHFSARPIPPPVTHFDIVPFGTIEAPEAFQVLSETPVDFRFQDETQDIAVRAPVIECDAHDHVVEVRFNNWIRDTLRLPEHMMDAWYEAYRRFWRLLHDPRHLIEFSLEPGQMITFDNRRVLHGRRAFDPNTGRRHLQGTYLDRDMLESRLRVLARNV
ncbi:TauD/TfdA family dioxygenase [Litchfieldella xinjiangensis]|uniref:TauD/TfdA family dioxygenase n=1 Tax=Litchfieldella xinjiangensis TaxID=1166948 RepID=UPI0006947436